MSESLIQSHMGSCILVKNVPAKANADKIMIHFQKRLNGGNGDVSSVTFPVSQATPDQAVVEFEDARTAAAVLQKPHKLLGHSLTVSKFNQLAFSMTDACISESLVSELCAVDKFEETLEALKNSTGIAVTKKKNKYHVWGQWHQVKVAAEQLEELTEKMKHSQPGSPSAKRSNKTCQSNSGVVPKTRQIQIDVNRNVYLFMKKLEVAELKTLRDAFHIKEQHGSKNKIFLVFEPKQSGSYTGESVQELISKVSERVHSTEFHCHVEGSSVQNVMKWFDLNCDQAVIVRDEAQNLVQIFAKSKTASENVKKLFGEFLRCNAIKTNVLSEFSFSDVELKVRIIHGDIVNQRVDAVADVIYEASIASDNMFCKGKIFLAGGKQLNERFQDALRKRDPRNSNRVVHIPAECGILECKSVIRYLCAKGTAKPDIKSIVLDILQTTNNNGNAKSVAISITILGENLKMDVHDEEVVSAVMCFVKESKSRNSSGISEINLLHREPADAKNLMTVFTTEKMKRESNQKTSSNGKGCSDEEKKDEQEECAICLENLQLDKQKLRILQCKHVFHQACIDRAFKTHSRCPVCLRVHGKAEGNQPTDGSMNVTKASTPLPGYPGCQTIVITYSFRGGFQGKNHPNPGKHYLGTTRTAYLPDNREGRAVLILLRRAFEARITFTVGTSVTTGKNNCITWNDIHHKTSIYGGPTNFGYPDPDYLRRVKEDLAARGITDDS